MRVLTPWAWRPVSRALLLTSCAVPGVQGPQSPEPLVPPATPRFPGCGQGGVRARLLRVASSFCEAGEPASQNRWRVVC